MTSASRRDGHVGRAATGRPPEATTRTLPSRPRLERLLDSWGTVPVVVVEGLPASGKSVLVSRWAGRALAEGRVRAVHGLPGHAVGPPQQRDGAPTQAGPVLHVVDHHDAPPAEVLDDLVERAHHAPEDVRVVLMSRGPSGGMRDPARLLAAKGADGVRVLPAPALGLTATEAAAVVRARWPRVADRDLRTLLDAVRGWWGLLEAAVRELPGIDGAPRDLVRALALCPTGARLMVESVGSLGGQDTDTLLALSVTPTFDAAEAAAVVDVPGADLGALARAGLVVPLDPAGGAPRWGVHPVLRQHLAGTAQQGTSGGRVVAEARARASHHFARTGRPVAAVQHALASHDTDVVTAAVVELGPALVALGRTDLLAPARMVIPGRARERNPSLLMIETLRLRAEGDVAGAAETGRRAVEVAASHPEGDRLGAAGPLVQADLALLDLWAARHGWVDPGAALSAAARMLEGASLESHAELSVARRAWLAVERGAVLLWTGDVTEAVRHLERALSLVEGTDYVHVRASALASRALAELADGHLQAAASTADECLALVGPTRACPDVARAEATAAWLASYRLDDAAARRHLEAVERGDAGHHDPAVQVVTDLLRATTAAQEGSFDVAWRLLFGRWVARQDLPLYLARLVHVVRAGVYAIQRDATGVRTEARTLDELGEPEDARLFDALAAALGGDVAGADRVLDELTARPTRHVTTGLAAAACRVRLLLGTDPDAVRGPLQDLLGRVWSSGAVVFLTVPLEAGPAYPAALRREVSDPQGHPWAAEALAVVQRVAPHLDDSAPAPVPSAAGSLTERELAVLRGLADGLSYTAIGRTLFITPNTVKSHLTSLYRKLGAESGLQAVSTARRLGMLP